MTDTLYFCFSNWGREYADEGILSSSQVGKCSVRNQSSSLSFQIPMEEIDKSSSIVAGNLEDNYGDKLNLHVNTSNDVEHINTGGALEGIKNAVENTSQSVTSTEEVVERSQPLEIEKDPRIWLPPEPEDEEDDIECSVADNDDDEEFSDGTKWGQPSSLSSTGEEHGRRYRFREERQKALVDVMNGRFKAFLDKLLTEVGVAFSEEAGESWLDIVSSLSWEAATLIKPDATEGRAMDPTSYVKVKCIASGSRSQRYFKNLLSLLVLRILSVTICLTSKYSGYVAKLSGVWFLRRMQRTSICPPSTRTLDCYCFRGCLDNEWVGYHHLDQWNRSVSEDRWMLVSFQLKCIMSLVLIFPLP